MKYLKLPIKLNIYDRGLLTKLSLILLSCFMLVSCKDSEDMTDNLKTQAVDVDLNVFFHLRAIPHPGDAYEKKVTSLRVYAFDENGYLDKMKRVQHVDGLTGEPYLMNMTIYSGQKTFCMVANEPASLSVSLEGIKNSWDLKKLIMTDTDFNFGGVNPDPLPMASTSAPITIVAGTNPPVTLSLERAVAKAEMRISKDSENTDDVKLISTQIVNTPSQSRLMDKNPLSATSLLGNLPLEDFASVVVGSTSATTHTMKELYLFEHKTGVGDPQVLKSTCIRLILDINGENCVYNIPLRVEDENGVRLNDVMRNYYYRMLVTVYPESIRIDYTISDWDDVPPWDKEPGENDTNMRFTDWDDEPNYEWTIPA